jgi:hypothetical protein
LSTKLIVFAIFTALTITATASAATKPWQWTPAQAATAIRSQGDEVYVEPERFLPRDLVTISCRGLGKRIAGRFVAFRCPAHFEDGGSFTQPVENRAMIWAKTRRAGGLCWSTTSLAAVPSGCLTQGMRAKGSVRDAFRAMVQQVGTLNHSFRCVANGSGFFSCSWMTAEVVHRGIVVFAPKPVARVLS